MNTQNTNTDKLKMASQLIDEVVNNQDNVSLNLLEVLKQTILDRINEIDFREIRERLEYNIECNIENNGGNEFSVNCELTERDIENEFSTVMSDIVEMEFKNVVDFKEFTKDKHVDFKTSLGIVERRLNKSDLFSRFEKNYYNGTHKDIDEFLNEYSHLEHHDVLRTAFIWENTLEGDEYWMEVHNELITINHN
jgi:hypothetical protein